MKNVRLIALDMDGTLLASDHFTVPERNIQAIRKADGMGIHVLINTGRMVEDASDFIRRLNLPCMIISANGARACDGPMPEGNWIYRCHLRPEDAHKALDILIPSGLMTNGFEDGYVHTVNQTEGREYHLVKRNLIKVRYGEESIRAAADRGILKIFAECGGFAGSQYDPRVEPVRRQIQEALPHLQVTSSAPGNIEITSPEAGKGSTLDRVAKHFGLTKENVMAVGDAANDLDMLVYARHSVAMGNASQDVKDVCRYMTGTNDECGVAQIMERVMACVLEDREEKHD